MTLDDFVTMYGTGTASLLIRHLAASEKDEMTRKEGEILAKDLREALEDFVQRGGSR